MKRIFIYLVILLLALNLQVYSQTFCQETKARSTAGSLEKYVYKKYLNKNAEEKKLHIGLARPVDNLSDKKRPLIIGVHGGGFVDFCPFEPCYVRYSENVLTQNFASQGFVTASIQYRLTSPMDFASSKISDEQLKEAHYKATQDVREAIKFIFENADKFGVDTENIFLIGTSAGAITVLHAAYLDNDEVPKNLVEKYGGLVKREKIKGVISLSGAIYDLSHLAGGDKVQIMIVHGSQDSIVPFDKGFYLGIKRLTPVYGGKAIFDEAQKRDIRAEGFFYDFGHEYPLRFLSEIFKNANEFIRLNLTCVNQNKFNALMK